MPAGEGGKVNFPLIAALAEDRLEQRGFSCTVGADERCDLPAVHVQVDIPQNLVPIQRYREVLHLETARPLALAVGTVFEWNHPNASNTAS